MCTFFKRFKKVKYPTEILPSLNKTHIACDLSDCLLIRHYELDEKIELISKIDHFIDQKYISNPSSRIVDLSTNLLGVFKEEHCRIEIIGNKREYFNKECNPYEEVHHPKYKKDFIIKNNKKYWYIKIGNIQDKPLEYINSNPKAIKFKALCKVIHTPMRWNFWHFSVRWHVTNDGTNYFYLNEKDQNIQKKYSKKISHNSRDIIARNILLEKSEDYKIIEEQYFTK